MSRSRKRRAALAAVFALAVYLGGTPARADLAAGLAALERNDYATAVKELQPLAEQGDPVAQVNLGQLYLAGHGVPQDRTKAAQWFLRAAEQGDAEGQQRLSMAYMIGDGVPMDTAEAVKWARRSAEQGHRTAQFGLGVLYLRGLGIERNVPEAIQWLTRASDQGEPFASLILAEVYETGEGTPQDLARARALYEKATVTQAPAEARDKATAALRRLDQGKASPDLSNTSAAIAAYDKGNYQEALRLFLPIAEGGNAHAQHIVGSMYLKGQGTPQNFVEAAKWFRRGANQNDANSLAALAVLYVEGKGVPVDYREAQRLLRRASTVPQQPTKNVAANWQLHEMIWIMDPKLPSSAWKPLKEAMDRNDTPAVLSEAQKLANSGSGVAEYLMARVYLSGKGVPRDAAKALLLLNSAADRGVAKAQSLLAQMYLTGEGVAKDPKRALALFQLAANQDDPVGSGGLCYMYENGLGVTADKKQAIAWCAKAAVTYPPGADRARVLGTIQRLGKS
jgi:TPR repeat protein